MTARTNEGVGIAGEIDVTLGFELDVDLSAPALISGGEDGNAGDDGSGVAVNLGIAVAATDLDGSEDSTTVEIVFGDLPSDALFSSGSMDEANALSLFLPGEYFGTVTSVVTALSPEGQTQTQTSLTITIAPTAETDAVVTVIPSTAWPVSVSDFDPNLPSESSVSVTLTLNGLPPGVIVSGVPNSTVSYDSAVDGDLAFSGTGAEYTALQLIFPADFSTESPILPGGILNGTLVATATEDPIGQSAPVTLRITPEDDVTIDDTLPDSIPDETDGATVVTPGSLLAPTITDTDGSESFTNIVLVVEGIPADAIINPIAAVAITRGPQSDGTETVTFMVAPTAADRLATYNSITFTLREDFSTANRSDLAAGDTHLPLTFRLSVETDEDQDLGNDTPTDGQQTVERVVEIGFQEDIDLKAPTQVTADEDGGVANSNQGVTVDLEIDIAIDDRDGSEVEDSASPFGAVVRMLFSGLPTDTVASEGTLFGPIWLGSVAEARDLSLQLPGDYNGTINALISVSTPEGFEITPQTIIINATPDAEVDGQVDTQETDAALPVRLADFVSIVDPAPGETIVSGMLVVTGLPDGTTTNGGSLAADGSGTFTLTYDYLADVTLPADLLITFPADFSTVNPSTIVSGEQSLVINDGSSTYTESATIPFNIAVEGDIDVSDNAITLNETDAVITFRPVDSITPQATDADSSESIAQITIAATQPPVGLRYSLDGTTYVDFPNTGSFSVTEADYQSLIFQLPQDYSTESPATTLELYVLATTDEGGSDFGRLSVTVDAEDDIVLNGPGTITLAENDTPGDQDEDATTTAPVVFTVSDAVVSIATDADSSETVANIDVTVNGLPDGAEYSTDGFQTVIAVTGGTFSLTALSPQDYDALQVRLPNDYSTTADITGTVTARTDASLLAGETDSGPDDGVETQSFSVTVTSEADVQIDVQDITGIEDLGIDIPLNIATNVTDIDGSETITAICVTFDRLPTNGPTTLTDGTQLTGPMASWTGTDAALDGLGVTSFPDLFSGVVGVTVNVVTDEGTQTGTSDSIYLNVTPVAEPMIVLSVDDSEAAVNAPGADNYVVKEDNGFLLQIDEQTPNQDGSEALTTITIDNLPAGWVASTVGTVDLALFETGAADIADAGIAGTMLTINLLPGITSFDGALCVTPLADDDRDVATLTGGDLIATVTSVDTATGLPNDTAADGVDVDVDAVVDEATQSVADTTVDENISGMLDLDLDLNGLALTDNDGSEVFDAKELTFTIATESDAFDPTTDLVLSGDPALTGYVNPSFTGSMADSVTYRFEPAGGAPTQQFSDALASIQLELPQHFNGVVTIDGTVQWHETTTPATYPGDVEQDVTDNAAECRDRPAQHPGCGDNLCSGSRRSHWAKNSGPDYRIELSARL